MTDTGPISNINSIKNSCMYCHAKQFCLARNLKESELLNFNNLAKRRKPLLSGERLYQGGDCFRSLYIVHSGSAKTTIESKDGEQQITGFYFPGDLIGLDGFENGYYNSSVEAVETCSFCEIPYKQFEKAAQNNPLLLQQLFSYISREISHEQELILLLGRMDSRRKLAFFLMTMSLQLQKKGYMANNINLSMTRHDIANYLGLAIETVSRLLTQFQNNGILKVKRRDVIILKQRQLYSIANNCSEDETILEEMA